MSGVQAAYGGTPSAVPKNLDEIIDEELLRQLWQEADNYSERRKIRARMYKLREKRLREMVQNDEESLGTLATTDHGTLRVEKSEAKVAVTNPPRKSSNIEINLQVSGDSAVTESISMQNVKLGGLTMRGVGSRDPKRPTSDEEIIDEKIEETKKTRNDRFTKIMNLYEQNPSDDAIISVSKSTYSVQNNALAGDSYQSMKHKEVRDSASPTRYDYSRRITESYRDTPTKSSNTTDSSEDNSKVNKKQTSVYGKTNKDTSKRVTARRLSKELTTSPISTSRNVGKQITEKISSKATPKSNRKLQTKETSAKNEYNKLDSYLNTNTDPNDELITEQEEVIEDDSGNIVNMVIQTRRKKDGTEYMSRRIARTTIVVDNEQDINEILIGNPEHEIVRRNVEETEENDGSKIKIISETRRRPDGIEYQTRNILKTSKIFDYDHPENVCYSEDDELMDTKETKEIDENGVEILSVTETRRKSTGEKYTTKKVYKTSKVASQISPSANDEILDRSVTEETSADGTNVKIVTKRCRTENGEEYTDRQVFQARKMTLSDIELLKGLPSLTSEDELLDKKETDEMDEAGNIVKKVTEMRKKKDGAQYSFDYVLRSVKCTEKEMKDIPYNVCDSAEISTCINDELLKEDVKEELQDDGVTVKTVIERRKAKDGTEYLRHRIIRIPKLPEPELQVASKDDELLEKDINEDVLDDGTQFKAITERRRSSTTGLQYTLRRMSKVFHPTIHLFGVDEIIDENVTEEETSDGVLTRTVIRRYQRSDDSVYTTHNVSKTYKNPVQVMPDECCNDELVDRSYDVRETHDGFLIRTVMETRCRSDGVHYTVERTEKISKNKSGLNESNAENDSLLTGSPGDTVISREQHEEPGETGIIIKTVLEERKRKDGTEYTNKATVKTTQILVPEHETSYVIIKPDPKNASGKDFMPSLHDEIVYTRKKEEIDDKGNTINIIIETRKSSTTGEKYNLTKRVRTTDVVMTDHGEKVLSKTKHRDNDTDANIRPFSKNDSKLLNNKLGRGTSSNPTMDRNVSVRKAKDDIQTSSSVSKNSLGRKNRITESKTLSSTTDDDSKSESIRKKNKITKKSVLSNSQVKDRNNVIGSNAKSPSTQNKSKSESNPENKKLMSDFNKKSKKFSNNKKSSGSSSETTSDNCSPERSSAGEKSNSVGKKSSSKSPSSDESSSSYTKNAQRVAATRKTQTNRVVERKEATLLKRDKKSSERELNLKNVKRSSKKTRSSDEEINNDIKLKERKSKSSVSVSKFEKKTPTRDVNYAKSVSHTGTSSPSSHTKNSAFKVNSLPADDIPLSVKSSNEKAINYVNLVKKRNSKGTIEKIGESSKKSDITRTNSTKKTAAIRDKYSKTISTETNSTPKKSSDFRLDKSILSQIIPDVPKQKVVSKPELRSVTNAKDNVSSKRSMFEKHSDIKTIEFNPPAKERKPVIEPIIVPKHIEPMCKKDRANSVDLTDMKSKDLKLASTKLVRDTMQSEPKHREESPVKEFSTGSTEREFSPKRNSITESITDYTSETNTKKMSISSVDSFYYERRDSESSFVKESSPSRFVTGKPIDQGVNTKKIKKLERAGSHKKLLEDLQPSSADVLSFAQKIENISDLTELENTLNKAENYEERRIIRGRIRSVKRANQSQQSSQIGKTSSEKYSFKSTSTLSPQIQRRSNQFTTKTTDVSRTYGNEDRTNLKSANKDTTSSTASKSISPIPKRYSESDKKTSEVRKTSASSVTSIEEKNETNFEKRKITSSRSKEIKRRSITEEIFGKDQRPIEKMETEPKSSSDSFTYSKSNCELRSKKENSLTRKKSLEKTEQGIIEKSRVKKDGKRQPYSEPLRHQKCKTELNEKYQTDVEKIISPYGVGPTDENGLPLFGLRALKRRNKPADIQPVEESIEEPLTSKKRSIFETSLIDKNILIEEQEDMNETKFETDSLNMDPDSLSEAEDEEGNVRSQNFKNIVRLHESKVIEPSSNAEPSSPPKQKLRNVFVPQEDKTDSKPYKTWDLQNDLVTRSDAVENIIAKHEILTSNESPKVEKRLTGILKKSTSSLSSSKVTDEKDVTEDVEEHSRKYSSDVSDFCGTRDSGRKSSFAEITLSTQTKEKRRITASKKKNPRLVDNARQKTDRIGKREEKLRESVTSTSDIVVKKARKIIPPEDKYSEESIQKINTKKYTKSKRKKAENTSSIDKITNEKRTINIEPKPHRDINIGLQNKSGIIGTSAKSVVTTKNKKGNKEDIREYKKELSKRYEVRKSSVKTEKTHSSSSLMKSSSQKNEKNFENKNSLKKEFIKELTTKGNRKAIKVKNVAETSNKCHIENVCKNNESWDEKVKMKEIKETKAQTPKKQNKQSTTDGKKVIRENLKKIDSQNQIPKSAKLVSKVQHSLESNITLQSSHKSDRNSTKNTTNKISEITAYSIKPIICPMEPTVIYDKSISNKTRKRNKKKIQEKGTREKEPSIEKISKGRDVKKLQSVTISDKVKTAVNTVPPKNEQLKSSKVINNKCTINSIKEDQKGDCCIVDYNTSLKNTITSTDVVKLTETTAINTDKCKVNYAMQKSIDENASSVYHSVMEISNENNSEIVATSSTENKAVLKTNISSTKHIASFDDENVTKTQQSNSNVSKHENNTEATKVSTTSLTNKQRARDKHSLERTELGKYKKELKTTYDTDSVTKTEQHNLKTTKKEDTFAQIRKDSNCHLPNKQNAEVKHVSGRSERSKNKQQLNATCNTQNVSKTERSTSKATKKEHNITEVKKAVNYRKKSKEGKGIKISDERCEFKNNEVSGAQSSKESVSGKNKENIKFEKSKITLNSTSVVEKNAKDSASVENVTLVKSELNGVDNTILEKSVKHSSKDVPNYMRPKSTGRRRSTPEREPEELENILLNSYIYTRCTKKVPIHPVSYDYTYVINKDSKPAGSNDDSYSVYFGPRETVTHFDDAKRYSITSDSLSIAEENISVKDEVGNIRKTIDYDDKSIVNTTHLSERSSAERKQSMESHMDIREQYLISANNVNIQTKESSAHTGNINEFETLEEEKISRQHDLETEHINCQQGTHLTVPKLETRQNEQVNMDNEKYLLLTDKELQKKYDYQVENRELEHFASQEGLKKDTTVMSSDAEQSSNALNKFDIDYTKVYADKMEQYYQSNSKHEETTEQYWNSIKEEHEKHSEEKLQSSHFTTKPAESFEQKDSNYVTFDGRTKTSKPLSSPLIGSATENRPVTICQSEVKEIFERTSHNEESTNEREYNKYENYAEVKTDEVTDMPEDKSFLNDNTKVTGITDVLSRMGATEAVDHEAKVTSDDQARSLLNRFLGAQVLMTGVESMMAQSVPSQNRAPASFGPGITKTTPSNIKSTSSSVQQSAPDIIQGVNICEVNDSFELNELLDSCEGYDERRRIRLRLKDVVAQEKASGDIIGLKKVTSTSRRIVGSKVATVGSSEGKGASAFNKFKQIDNQQARTTSGPQVAGPLFTLSTSLNRSASGVKDMIMTWCQCRTRNYKGVKIENFSTSWNDGLAFCALIHHFYPDAFNFDALNPKNRRYNFALAFRTADERADVYPLLDVEDMVAMQKPDWKCVFTYVQTLYKRLKDE